MSALHSLRTARLLARSVLAWFVVSIGLAIAAPLVHPQAVTLVCSSAGVVKLQASGDDGTPMPPPSHTWDCVMCLALGAPPMAASPAAPALPALSYAWFGLPRTPTVWRTASPLPARGPPAHA